ncbi:MAG: tyrosine-type recombinase/integrase [Geminicoccaceae bacterium]
MKTRLPYIQSFRDRHGHVRTYYRRQGQRQAIDGKPGSAEWVSNYTRIHASFETGEAVVPDHETFRFAVQDFLESPRFQAMAANTKSGYRSVLGELIEAIGDQRIANFSRGDIIRIRDTIAKRSPSRAVVTLNVLKGVFEQALDAETIDRDPTRRIRKPPGYKPEPHRKWTDHELGLFRERGRPYARRAMLVLLHTGLRVSDAIQLKRDVLLGSTIDLTTQKTKANVVIPIHDELRAEFERPLPIESVFMICSTKGRTLTKEGVLDMFRREFRLLDIPREEQPTTHGLRKNAVVALIEAGATEQSINAITGQSIPTIRHYAQEYDRRKLAMKVVPLWKDGER